LADDVALMLEARPDPGTAAAGEPATHASSAWRTRAMVKVQDGCDQRCAYCIVPDARGAPRSRPLEQVLADVASLVAGGTREIVLTGVNIGGWHEDEAGLPELIEAVCDATPGRVRISSIEPTHVTPRFLDVAARPCAQGVLCPHFHIPLQSGSDEVLSAMRRPYDTATFRRVVADLRAAVPGVAITTDVIAGFPGETSEQAQDTARFCAEAGFQRLHVFRYSERPGTPAATMPGSVATGERASRAADLRALSERLLAGYTSGRIGQRANALVEEKGTATTEDYLRVEIAGGQYPVGSLVEVRLHGPNIEGMLTAEPCGGNANVATNEGVRG
jgi:threonylcarbamoyladenosine tRNA methylthiotransferase MtaB